MKSETLAALWSEHCFHGTLKSPVRLRWRESGRWRERRYGNLLNDTIFAATRKIRKPWVMSAFRDNAGIVAWDRRWALAAKVETHNHPSALDPVHGAATGLGGVIRDILGAGRGARPCLTSDVFGVGPGPEGRRTLRGLVAGVREYGNRIGTPTAAGAVLLDEGYEGLPLVFCGAVGVMPRRGRRGTPRSAVTKRVRVGDAVVLVGGRTGRDGLGGAVFASRAMGARESGAVIQRGDPLTGRCLWVALLRARDENLYGAVTDLGAGGIAVAAVDLASWNRKAGIEVDLDLVATKASGLKPEEIWLSESQERMLLAVPPRSVRRLQALFAEEASEATVVGRITGDGVLAAKWQGRRIVRLGLDRIRNGPTLRVRRAVWVPTGRVLRTTSRVTPEVLSVVGAGLVPAPSLAEAGALRAEILRQYDHEIQGGTIGKPLGGPDGNARHGGQAVADAVVIRPVLDEPWGVAVATGIRIVHDGDDPHDAGRAAVAEAVAKVTAAGADRRRIALLDNVAWGNTDRPETLGAIARALQGLADGAVEAGAPFISGKDSLRNTRITSAGSVDMPGTILVTALGFVPDPRWRRR